MSTPVATADKPAIAATALPPHPFVPCDAHALGNTQAIFDIALPNGGHISLCAHDAYKHFGILEQTRLHAGNRQQGSDN